MPREFIPNGFRPGQDGFRRLRSSFVRRGPQIIISALGGGILTDQLISKPGYEQIGFERGLMEGKRIATAQAVEAGYEQGLDTGTENATAQIIKSLNNALNTGMIPVDEYSGFLDDSVAGIEPLLRTNYADETTHPQGRIALVDGKIVEREGNRIIFDSDRFKLNTKFKVLSATLSHQGDMLELKAWEEPDARPLTLDTPHGQELIANPQPIINNSKYVHLILTRPKEANQSPSILEIPDNATAVFTGEGKLLVIYDIGDVGPNASTNDSYQLTRYPVSYVMFHAENGKFVMEQNGVILDTHDNNTDVQPSIVAEGWNYGTVATSAVGRYVAYSIFRQNTKFVEGKLINGYTHHAIITELNGENPPTFRITPQEYYTQGPGLPDKVPVPEEAAETLGAIAATRGVLDTIDKDLSTRVFDAQVVGPGPKDSFIIAFGGFRKVKNPDKPESGTVDYQQYTNAIALAIPPLKTDEIDPKDSRDPVLKFINVPTETSEVYLTPDGYEARTLYNRGTYRLATKYLDQVYDGTLKPEDLLAAWVKV